MKRLEMLRPAGFGGFAAVFGAALLVTACGDVTKSIGGLEGGSIQAVKAPALSLPPDYNLRPPSPGGRGAPNQRSADMARNSLFGTNEPGSDSGSGERRVGTSGRSAGETVLVNKVQTQARVEPGIRDTVDRETEELLDSERGFVDKVLKWDEDAPDGQAIDPNEEVERLEDQGVLSRIITGEDKPQIERNDGLF